MHKLWIMRHGQAQSMAPTDQQRSLTDIGRQQAKINFQHLSQQTFTHVFVSPYLRAQQTFDELKSQGLIYNNYKTVDWVTPDVDTQPALDELLALKGDDLNVLIVCHQTFAGRLATHLCDGHTRGRHVDTAAIVAIETEVFASQCGTLINTFSSY